MCKHCTHTIHTHTHTSLKVTRDPLLTHHSCFHMQNPDASNEIKDSDGIHIASLSIFVKKVFFHLLVKTACMNTRMCAPYVTEEQKVTFINDTQTARQCIRVKVAFLILSPPVVWSPLSTVSLHYVPGRVTHWAWLFLWLLFWHSVCLMLYLPQSFSSSLRHWSVLQGRTITIIPVCQYWDCFWPIA